MLSSIITVSWLGDLLHWLGALFATHGYLIMAVLIAGESAGLPLPGETSLLAGAVAAERGHLNIYLVVLIAAGAAILGDNVGYLFGRHFGRRLLEHHGRLFRISAQKVAVLDYSFARHGAKMVFFGRWVTILRATAGPLAGASRMPWPRFALFNALGGLSWAATVGTLGYLFSASISAVKSTVGIIGIVALVLVIVAGIVFVRRAERRLFAPVTRNDTPLPPSPQGD